MGGGIAKITDTRDASVVDCDIRLEFRRARAVYDGSARNYCVMFHAGPVPLLDKVNGLVYCMACAGRKGCGSVVAISAIDTPHFAQPVDMAADDMTAEPFVQTQSLFQVHRIADLALAEAGAGERFARHINIKPLCGEFNYGQTRSGYCD